MPWFNKQLFDKSEIDKLIEFETNRFNNTDITSYSETEILFMSGVDVYVCVNFMGKQTQVPGTIVTCKSSKIDVAVQIYKNIYSIVTLNDTDSLILNKKEG